MNKLLPYWAKNHSPIWLFIATSLGKKDGYL